MSMCFMEILENEFEVPLQSQNTLFGLIAGLSTIASVILVENDSRMVGFTLRFFPLLALPSIT